MLQRELTNGLQYALKKHDAWRPHYDLRLQFNNVLLSWALPKGPSCIVDEPREAIEMKDHRLENILFEGLHSTGTIMHWDQGLWIPKTDAEDLQSSLERGVLRFVLRGERLGGAWTLMREDGTKRGYRSNWTLRKQQDAFAARPGDPCVLRRWSNSVRRGGRSLEEIRRDWVHPAPRQTMQPSLF